MKRILVIDESEVIRETLALILGREFAVVKRPLGTKGFPVAETRDDVDLLIFGVTPHLGSEAAALLRFAAQLPFAVLFLVDSKTIARAIESKAEVACLTKPFNPYELHEKVGQLLARRAGFAATPHLGRGPAADEFSAYLDFPFLSRSAASLVRRFATARLPLLLSGEMGCGQDRVAEALCRLEPGPVLRLSIDAADVSEEYFADLRLRLSGQASFRPLATTLLIQHLDKSSSAAQSRILNFLEETAGKAPDIRYVTTANGELLERVFRGEFLETLYYKLATLTLKLLPLRDRRDEISALTGWLARTYAKKLDLVEPEFSAGALQRLSTYFWFGNVNELETVIARTLAYHGKPHIEDGDLLFDFSSEPQPDARPDIADTSLIEAQISVETSQPKFEIYGGSPPPSGSANGHSKTADLNVVIHELAHELKNPMVTIKTFAQLLGERYQDETFRSRFQEVVGHDIERMDDLLEMMIEFADFAKPRLTKVSLVDKVRTVLAKIREDFAKRQNRFELKESGGTQEIRTDEAQLEYILKNILKVTLAEAQIGSEIEIDVSTRGTLSIRYQREGERVKSISHYLDEKKSAVDEKILPLRVLLAKHLLERNGGRFAVERPEDEREILTLEFSLAEH